MISGVSNAPKQLMDLSGLHRVRLVQIFEKQISEREGGHFSRFHGLNNKLIYAYPLVFLGAVAGVAFFPITILTVSIAALVTGIYGVRVAVTLILQRNNRANLQLCVDELKNKYIDTGIVEERDIKELIPFADKASLEEMINAMNQEQKLAAYAANPLRTRPILALINEWMALFNFDHEPSQEESKDHPGLLRVLEIEGKRAFKLPDVDEEWDDLMTEQLDHYYATHTDLYSLRYLIEVLDKHPDCEALRTKLAINLLSINIKSSFFDWKKLWDMMKIVNVKEVDERILEFLKHKLSLEFENPSKEFNEIYSRLKEADKLPPYKFNLKNIRPLYELGSNAVKQGVVHFAKNNADSIRNSNIWEVNEMPEPIKKIIYPDQVKRYF